MDEDYDGGMFNLSALENLIKPVKFIKKLSNSLQDIRYDKKKAFVKPEDKIYAHISKDVYNKQNNRSVEGYIPNLSNDEIGVYKIDNQVIVGLRGTATTDDIKTDALLSIGKIKNTDRYKRNKKHLEQIFKKLGRIDVLTGHSLAGNLAKELGVFYPNSRVVVFNAGCGIMPSYGKKSTFYVSKGDPVSATCMLNNTDDIRIVPSKGDSVLDRHAIDNFTGGFIDFSKLKVYELKDLARRLNLKKYSKMNKTQLIKLLEQQ
jgi:hypothetical protein